MKRLRDAVAVFAVLANVHCTAGPGPRDDAAVARDDASFDAGRTHDDLPEAGERDSSSADAQVAAPLADAETIDAADAAELFDADTVDAALDAADGLDAGLDAASSCTNLLEASAEAPGWLSQAGLYADIASKTIADELREVTPQFPLWSDGADKTRWLYLPECDGMIDTSDMDDWSFPVGTRAFKQFVVDGKLIETRLVHRYGEGEDDFLYAHYLWNEAETDASLIDGSTEPSALVRPKGTDYTVPAPDTCASCHGATGGASGGLPARFLGVSAIQLSHNGGGVTLQTLAAAGRLSHESPDYAVPGDAAQRAALGYLHANCGFCHNPSRDGVSFPVDPFSMLLETSALTVDDTAVYTTAVNVEVQGYYGIACTHRIYPGDPGLANPPAGDPLSCIYERMSIRGGSTPRQMPPIDSHKVDSAGLATLRAWIMAM